MHTPLKVNRARRGADVGVFRWFLFRPQAVHSSGTEAPGPCFSPPALPGPGATLSRGVTSCCPSSRTSPGNAGAGDTAQRGPWGAANPSRHPQAFWPGPQTPPPVRTPNSHCTHLRCANACEPQGSVRGSASSLLGSHPSSLPASELPRVRTAPEQHLSPPPLPAVKAPSDRTEACPREAKGGHARTRLGNASLRVTPGTRPDRGQPQTGARTRLTSPGFAGWAGGGRGRKAGSALGLGTQAAVVSGGAGSADPTPGVAVTRHRGSFPPAQACEQVGSGRALQPSEQTCSPCTSGPQEGLRGILGVHCDPRTAHEDTQMVSRGHE